jgi:2-iminobutanoate/2-iminopropanoate deaminase
MFRRRSWRAVAALATAACAAVAVFSVTTVVAHDSPRPGGDPEGKAPKVQQHRNAYRITTDPDPYEPFAIALGYRVGNLLYISGQASLDQQGNIVGVGDFDAQAAQAFENLERVLQAGGSSLDKVVKVNIYMTDISQFPKIVELRQKYFTAPYPADTIVEVSSLALPELMIEIEAIAIVEGKIIDPGPGGLTRR